MKKVCHLTLLTGLSLFFSIQAIGQNVLKVNAGGLLFGAGSLSFERFVNETISAQADAVLHYRTLDGLDFSGGGFALSLRRYFTDRDRPGGLYASFGAGYNFVSFNDIQDEYFNYSFPSFSLQIGHQWKLSRFSLELGVGGQYGYIRSLPDSSLTEEFYGDGIWPMLSLGAGYIF